MKKFISILFMIFATSLSFGACISDQIDIAGDGTNCVDTKFTLTTSATDSFEFYISAAGSFYVDCGNGGTLSGTGASDKTIVRSDTTGVIYTCSWNDTDNARTIRFAGQATGYRSGYSDSNAAIRFYTTSENSQKVTAISGSLGAIFGTVDNPVVGVAQPRFVKTFSSCSNMTGEIPSGLFYGVYGAPVSAMFNSTFAYCRGLTGVIPETLFCENPNNPNATNCIYGAPTYMMFDGTFSGCNNLVGPIPEKLFVGIHGAPASQMFNATFWNCSGLTGSIPEKLFCQNPDNPNATNCIYGAPAATMFQFTFNGCEKLSGYIPKKLFAGIHGPVANRMFNLTFMNCYGLKGFTDGTTTITYVPGDFLSGIPDGTAEYAADGMFHNTGWTSVCPKNTYDVTRPPFDDATRPWCTPCPNGTFAPSGSGVCYPHILHVGDSNVYLKSTKQTTPSLNIRIGNDVFYANMTTTRTRMSKDSSHYLHVKTADNIHYYVCDDTTCPQ